MSYGLSIRNDKGKEILGINDRIGRVVGFHEISPIPMRQNVTKVYDHSNLLSYGDVFCWMNPDFYFDLIGDCNLIISNGVITLKFKVEPRFNEIADKDRVMRIYYGVK